VSPAPTVDRVDEVGANDVTSARPAGDASGDEPVAPPRLTAGQLNRATLERQLLLRRVPLGAIEAVRRLTALQAQMPASPYVALWNRVVDFVPADLDEAFAARQVVKATLMRITLHAVHVDDYPWFHAAMQPTLRGARLGDRRFTETGVTAAEADALVPRLRELVAEPRTSAECQAIHDEPRVWWALRHYGPLWHAPTGGPWSFGPRNAFVAATTPSVDDVDAAARHLVRRYLEGFGPASLHDIAQFVLFPSSRTRTRELLASMDDELQRSVGPDGTELVDLVGGTVPDADVDAPPRLLPMWDSVLLAYADRSRIIPPEYRQHVTRRNGDVLPTLLVDGYVAGVWRATDDGIEAAAFHPLSDATWDGLASEAAALAGFLREREPRPFSRHHHWWAKGLPSAEVRLLGA
jgi:hypothetical protein